MRHFRHSIVCLPALAFLFCSCLKSPEDLKVTELEPVAAITEWSPETGTGYFWKIDSFCLDNRDHLYVADSGWGKILEFDPSGAFLAAHGGKGQGPGEFQTTAGSGGLRISFGNDGLFYVLDVESQRIQRFSSDFRYLDDFNLAFRGPRLMDTPRVNSRGDLYLVYYLNDTVIQCYDKNFKLKTGLLPAEAHFRFPYFPETYDAKQKFLIEDQLRNGLTRKDHLFALSNYAMTVFHFDSENRLVGEFDLADNKSFINDFKVRLKKVRERSEHAGIYAFHLFLDYQENLCLAYFNSKLANFEIYRYSQDGKLIDVLRTSEKLRQPFIINSKGVLYARDTDGEGIRRFRIKD